MSVQRKSRLGLAARGATANDASNNFIVAYACEPGDRPSAIVVSMRGLDLTAAKLNSIGRLVAYIKKNIDQDPPSVVPQPFGAQASAQTNVNADSEIIVDLDIGCSAGPGQPTVIPIEGVTMQDGESFVVECSGMLDSGLANQVAIWSLAVMGHRKAQERQQQT